MSLKGHYRSSNKSKIISKNEKKSIYLHKYCFKNDHTKYLFWHIVWSLLYTNKEIIIVIHIYIKF